MVPDDISHTLTRLAETVPEYLGAAIIDAASGEVIGAHARAGDSTDDLATWAAAGSRLLLGPPEASMAVPPPLPELHGQSGGTDSPLEAWLLTTQLVQVFVRESQHADRVVAVLCRRTTSMGLLLTVVRSTLQATFDPAAPATSPRTSLTTSDAPGPLSATATPHPPPPNTEEMKAVGRARRPGPTPPSAQTPLLKQAPADTASSVQTAPSGTLGQAQNPLRDTPAAHTDEPSSLRAPSQHLPRRRPQQHPWDLTALPDRSPAHGFEEEAAEVDESLLRRVLGGLRSGR